MTYPLRTPDLPPYSLLVLGWDVVARAEFANRLRLWFPGCTVAETDAGGAKAVDPAPDIMFVLPPADCEDPNGLLDEVARGIPTIPYLVVNGGEAPELEAAALRLGAQDVLAHDNLRQDRLGQVMTYAVERQVLQNELGTTLRELERTKTEFQSLITDNADAVVVVGAAATVQFANPAAERLLGRSQSKLVGRPFGLPQTEDHAAEVPYRRDDGRTLVLSIRCMPTLWNGEKAYIATIRDVTDRKNMEEALAQAKQRAEEASEAKSRFLANMSHELRTPLNAVLGFAEVMGLEIHGDLGSKRYRDYADNIAEAALYLTELINDLLDLSKIEAGDLRLSEAEFNLGQIIDSVVKVLQPKIAKADLQLALSATRRDFRVLGDVRQTKQILFNLISNAIRFTPARGEITINSYRNAGGELVMSVSDTGIGIAKENIPVALAAFGQVDSPSHTGIGGGTGLGLTLSKRIAEVHGGTLNINSAEGVGTTVTVTYPAYRVVESEGARGKPVTEAA